jgi:nucleoside-diphosphate-sugar epimerase
LPVPYRAALGMAKVMDSANARLCDGRAPIPNLLSPPALIARGRRFEYSNRRLHETLGWTPSVSYSDALARTFDV